ncbi:Nuclear pore protein GLE2 [Saitozyma sp. JCM 24511]|nr:Nuclear pore protein GLE2 [Saitozyma sp. JCM 24511]
MLSSFRPAQKDIELVQPPTDSVSDIEFAPTQPILAVASWDNNVRLYNVDSSGQSQPRAMYSHEGPVLDLAWSSDSSRLFSAGCDNAVRMYDVQAGGTNSQQVAAHDAPVKCVEFTEVNGTQVLVTAGWDKKLKYWDMRTPNPIGQVDLSERAYSMSTAQKLLVVATADRKIDIFNLDNPMVKYKTIESPLKWQTRVVSCFPTGDAYAIGSIEGRVAIQYPGDEDKPGAAGGKNYSFKCHRYDVPTGSMPGTPAQTGSQHVFGVNEIAFHKTEGTFCTGGSDGSITFWDGVARTKLKALAAKDLNNGNPDARPPQWGLPVVSCSFNHTLEIFAYALSYDWYKGHSGVPPAGQPATRIMLHAVNKEEVQRKPKK